MLRGRVTQKDDVESNSLFCLLSRGSAYTVLDFDKIYIVLFVVCLLVY
jgi:hypothetical protein